MSIYKNYEVSKLWGVDCNAPTGDTADSRLTACQLTILAHLAKLLFLVGFFRFLSFFLFPHFSLLGGLLLDDATAFVLGGRVGTGIGSGPLSTRGHIKQNAPKCCPYYLLHPSLITGIRNPLQAGPVLYPTADRSCHTPPDHYHMYAPMTM